MTGAPLPGVIVEARSPALIEKVRTAVTDGSGQYRIEDLRPGLYTVTFSLAGWSPSVRSAIELTGSFTATVDARLGVAPLADAVTIIGQVPPVDVHNSTHEMTLGGDILRAIPTVRSYNAVVPLVPGVVTNANDIVTGTATTQFPIHGGRTNEGRLFLDGLNIGSPPSGNSATSYVVDVGQAQEVTFSTAGASGEAETAGLVMNIVPKTGGNTTHGSVFASGTRRETPIRQPHTDAEGSRCRGGDSTQRGLRRLRHPGWSDPEGSGVVLRQRPHRRQHAGSGQRLLQPERRRSLEMAVRARLQPA